MKGRRKLKTAKWQLIAQFKQEALEAVRNSASVQKKWLRNAVEKGKNEEPIGRLAGPPR